MSPASGARHAATPEPSLSQLAPMLLLAWCVPGAAHVALGHRGKGLVLGSTLLVMFACGLAFGGRLFPFRPSEPLVFLAALAEWGAVVPRLLTALLGLGLGDVVAVTYEYGNTFLITAGLLNALVVLDAYDLAAGRKAT